MKHQSQESQVHKAVLACISKWQSSVLTPLPMQDAKRGVLFKSFPPVLFLQLKRFEFDYERGITVKVHSLKPASPSVTQA